ncbi:MAG TPA: thioredoxin family protein [Steroidobacteraceae bacterium]|nr:thioredoxin family protein [Steroidobacteraceae bacterium]
MALAISGCQQRSQGPAAADAPAASASGASSSAAPTGIAWFQGGLEAAFAAAAAQHKPVFLYWGAEWCPPCHDLKAHVFSRRDFQEKLRQFIPVFLDGDAAGAQRIAGDFKVLGYPTVVVLRADRTEIARIGGGMDLARYADVLDLALEGVRPLPELLAALRDDASRQLTSADCRRLAYNGWSLDPVADSDPKALIDTLQLAAQRCPPESRDERDRLLVTAAGLVASEERASIEKGGKPSPRLRSLMDSVENLLADPQRSLGMADALLDIGDDFFVVVRHADGSRRAQLQQQWFGLMDALEADARYSDTLRLMSAGGRLYASKALDDKEKIPAAVAARARTTLDAFMLRSYDPDARSGVVNSAEWVLTLLGDDAQLRTLLEGEIQTSKTAFYYMPDLADLDEKMGHKDQALMWLERAYREARGPATRFQWGVLYVNGLLRMAQRDEPRIRAAALEVIGELEGPDRIHARARARLDRLHESLRKWAAETKHPETLTVIAQRWSRICAALPASDPASRECPRLMAATGA